MVQRGKALLATAIAAGIPVAAFMTKNEKMLLASFASFGAFGIGMTAFGTKNRLLGSRARR
jgi:hypothetical protein